MAIGNPMQWLWRYKWYPILLLVTSYLIVSISNYYSTVFTDYNVSMIHNAGLFYQFTNYFNAYTEMVSTNSTTETNYQNYQSNMLGTLFVIFTAYISMLVFSILRNIRISAKDKRDQQRIYAGSYTAMAFFVSSMVAAYAADVILHFQNIFGTGVSFFGIDSTMVTLVFSLIDMVMFAMIIRAKMRNADAIAKSTYLISGALFIAIFAFLAGLSTILLFQYLYGLPALDIYLHSLNLAIFITLFSVSMVFRKQAALLWTKIVTKPRAPLRDT